MILWDAELTRFDWLFPFYTLLISLKTEWRQLLNPPIQGLGRKLYIPIQLQAESR